jgi:hypothetical protein
MFLGLKVLLAERKNKTIKIEKMEVTGKIKMIDQTKEVGSMVLKKRCCSNN